MLRWSCQLSLLYTPNEAIVEMVMRQLFSSDKPNLSYNSCVLSVSVEMVVSIVVRSREVTHNVIEMCESTRIRTHDLDSTIDTRPLVSPNEEKGYF